ncbi:MAG: Sec-independent protein translocase protein TatB [Hyphomonadaceae bacterium]|nr:Sec-independent protein translocase protein TatB [Hyphomonadaceae bacterium]
MFPSLGFNEIVIIGILALLVVGPKDLPLLFRKIGRWTAKLRGMAQEFRTGFDELARQAELDELKKEVDALRRTTSLNEIRSELTKPLGTLEDYAGIKSQPAVAKPAVTPPTPETPAPLEAPIAPARGPSGPAINQSTPVTPDAVAETEAEPEGEPSNVTPIRDARSLP